MQPQFFQIGITDCSVRMIAGFKESKIDAQVWLLAIVDRPMGRFQAETPVARNEDPNEAFHPRVSALRRYGSLQPTPTRLKATQICLKGAQESN